MKRGVVRNFFPRTLVKKDKTDARQGGKTAIGGADRTIRSAESVKSCTTLQDAAQWTQRLVDVHPSFCRRKRKNIIGMHYVMSIIGQQERRRTTQTGGHPLRFGPLVILHRHLFQRSQVDFHFFVSLERK